MSWLTQYFLNPGFVLSGAALAALPIIIHLLSRLRYKKVRFAAMEFLLQSDELNRRRLVIEQLLLLLLRVLAVLLIMFLLARLVLDSSRMMLLRGATTHHVLILDDSLSMRQLSDGDSVFDQAVVALERILSQDDSRSGSLRVSVLTITMPERPLVTDRELDGALVQELIPRLRNLKCSYQAASPVAALTVAERILAGDGGVAPHVHVITDLRASDWIDQPDVVKALKSLGAIKSDVSLIQLTQDTVGNVAVSQLSARTLAVAVGIPWRMSVACHNHSSQRSSGLRATVFVDGRPLPVKVLIPDIEAHETVVLDHDIVFEASGTHDVEVRLEEDALLEDNSRFLVADVTERRTVLIVDDEGSQNDASYIAAALSADPQLTGIATSIRTSDVLTTSQWDDYDCIYLLNIRELPADATERLGDYVRDGGGVVWFPDDQATTTWYNTTLRSSEQVLFPVPLGTVTSIPVRGMDEDPEFQSPVFESHPVFAVYADPELPLAETIQVSKWFKVAENWNDDMASGSNVKVLAQLKNGDPVIFEHSLGSGHILTFLTTAGRRWTNWPVLPAAPGYVVMNMLMHQYLQKPSDAVQLREVGERLKFDWPVDEYTESVEVYLPEVEGEDSDADSFLRLKASPVSSASSVEESGSTKTADQDRLTVSIPQANRPGVYRIKRFLLEGDSKETWLALSVPTTESNLATADPQQVERQGGLRNVQVITADVAGGLSGSDAGRELRWFLVGLLIFVLVCEQLLSLRLSFHPEVKS